MPNGFESIVNPSSKILILGTLPSPESLRQQKYYANKNNKFWKIIFSVLNAPEPENYQAKYEFLLGKNLALWDVLQSAEREGALDQNIKHEVPNDFNDFFRKYPNINKIIFNGKKSEDLFKKYFREIYDAINHVRVLSSSPACARPLELKIDNWKQAIN